MPQVTLSGLEHGLVPIAKACSAVHIFDRPAVFLDALWLPFRRDAAELEAALRECGPVRAIFGHADVVRRFSSASPDSQCCWLRPWYMRLGIHCSLPST